MCKEMQKGFLKEIKEKKIWSDKGEEELKKSDRRL